MPHTSDNPASGAANRDPGEYAVDVFYPAAGIVLAHVTGELDYSVAGNLRRRLLAHVTAGTSILVVDLTATAFFSAAAIEVLLVVDELARAIGVQLRVVANTRTVLRPLQLTGVDRRLRIHDSVASATRR